MFVRAQIANGRSKLHSSILEDRCATHFAMSATQLEKKTNDSKTSGWDKMWIDMALSHPEMVELLPS